MILSEKQEDALSKILDWYDNSDEKRYVLAGYAGAGKTTLAKTIAKMLRDTNNSVRFCAYTGKAANVLREKGCDPASTIHRAIYKLIDGPKMIKVNGEWVPDPASSKKLQFSLDPDSPLGRIGLTIVDEYSMLSEKLINDIESVARRVLYLGDPFQLPPVQGECSLKPDLFLDEVHRQALDNPIIRHATNIRTGVSLKHCDEGDFFYGYTSKVAPETYMEADQLIVGRNKTRRLWNMRYRTRLGYKWGFPEPGDKIICLKNNNDIGIFNGMIGTAKKQADFIHRDIFTLDFDTGDDLVMEGLKTWAGDIRGDDPANYPGRELNRFDFAYAITCHKSQGSEFDKVLVYNEPVGKSEVEKRRWLYTAITRAKSKVTLVDPVW